MLRRLLMIVLPVAFAACTLKAFGQQKPIPDPLEQNAALVYWQAFALIPPLSEEESRILLDVLDGKRAIEEKEKAIVARSENALHYLHRGAKLERTAWGVAWDEGPHAVLPHLSKARELTRIAVLRAHARFDEGKAEPAVDDLMATLKLGRDCGREGPIVLIPLLVDYAVEAVVIHALARRLPELDGPTRADIKQRLAKIPSSRSLSDAIQGEKDVFLSWLIEEVQKPNPKQRVLDMISGLDAEDEVNAFMKLEDRELLPATTRMAKYYDLLIKSVQKSPKDVTADEEKMMQEIKQNGPKDLLSYWLVPSLAAGRRAEAMHQTRWALLHAGLDVLENGKNALKDHRDPFGEGPFEYQETDRGFVLTSDWEQSPGKRFSLTFGK